MEQCWIGEAVRDKDTGMWDFVQCTKPGSPVTDSNGLSIFACEEHAKNA